MPDPVKYLCSHCGAEVMKTDRDENVYMGHCKKAGKKARFLKYSYYQQVIAAERRQARKERRKAQRG